MKYKLVHTKTRFSTSNFAFISETSSNPGVYFPPTYQDPYLGVHQTTNLGHATSTCSWHSKYHLQSSPPSPELARYLGRQKLVVHPRKLTWIPKIAIFERRYSLKTIFFGIYVGFRRGRKIPPVFVEFPPWKFNSKSPWKITGPQYERQTSKHHFSGANC